VVAVTSLSTIAMLLYPLLAHALHLPPALAGLFLGGAIHDVAQVVGAGYLMGQETGDAATIVKLFRVSMLALNGHRYVEFYFGVPWMGGVFVPLNFRLAGAELAAIVRDSGTRVLLVDAAHVDLAREMRSACPQLEHLVFADGDAAPPDMLSYEALLAEASPEPAHIPAIGEPVGIFYTGGTTGAPKGVVLTHNNMITSALSAIAQGMCREADTALVSAALFHVAAMCVLVPMFMVGGPCVLLARFTPESALAAIDAEGITVATLVSTMLRMLLDAPNARERRLNSLKRVYYGASPAPPTILQELDEVWPHVSFIHGYGLTEATATVTLLPACFTRPEMRELGRWRSIGLPVVGADVIIADENGDELPPGENGELLVRGSAVMKEYWGKPEQTAEALRGGWLHTGDAGYKDEEGFIYLVDRLKDMIISGGENVYSTEVENAIYSLPGVSQCAVIGAPHPRWGETVHAVVVPAQGAQVESAEVIAHCRTLIAGYKCPRSVEIRHEPLPLSGANKIDKRALRAAYRTRVSVASA